MPVSHVLKGEVIRTKVGNELDAGANLEAEKSEVDKIESKQRVIKAVNVHVVKIDVIKTCIDVVYLETEIMVVKADVPIYSPID